MTRDTAQTQRSAVLIRNVGSLERLFYRYSERNPAHFLVVAEFAEIITPARLKVALAAVQRRHPLLSAHVEDRPGARLGFYSASTVAPIDLTVRINPDSSWRDAAAEELIRPFDRSCAPMVRALLLQGPASSSLLLTFDHTIADGISSVIVLNDVVVALNDGDLSELPTPPSQEQMIARTLTGIDPLGPSELPDEPRMRQPNAIRPFDGSLTAVQTIAMTDAGTTRLVDRCRAEGTTVHAAILVATSRVRSAERGEDFVRVLNPINFRALIGANHDLGLYFQCTWTGLAPWDGTPFWDQARAMTTHLNVARSARGILAASLFVQQAIPAEAERGHAEELFTHLSPWEMIVSNLGVQHLGEAGQLRPIAIWGPVVQSQIAGEYVTGITTYEGSLRMVACGYSVPSTFLENVTDTLATALGENAD